MSTQCDLAVGAAGHSESSGWADEVVEENAFFTECVVRRTVGVVLGQTEAVPFASPCAINLGEAAKQDLTFVGERYAVSPVGATKHLGLSYTLFAESGVKFALRGEA